MMQQTKSKFLEDTDSKGKERVLTQHEKRVKSKYIKKIMKERLNIDCLRMLCDDSPDEDLDNSRLGYKKSAANLQIGSGN